MKHAEAKAVKTHLMQPSISVFTTKQSRGFALINGSRRTRRQMCLQQLEQLKDDFEGSWKSNDSNTVCLLKKQISCGVNIGCSFFCTGSNKTPLAVETVQREKRRTACKITQSNAISAEVGGPDQPLPRSWASFVSLCWEPRSQGHVREKRRNLPMSLSRTDTRSM